MTPYEKRRLATWKRRGIKIRTYGEYDLMYDLAGGKCEACGKPLSRENGNSDMPTAQLDHDHRTGEPRGILCANCNRTVGFVETYNYKNRQGVGMYLLKTSYEEPLSISKSGVNINE